MRDVRRGNYRLYDAPWLNPDPQVRLLQMSLDDIASVHEAVPPGVTARHRASPFYPVQVPDLIGVKDRHYLDRTGLQQHRDIADLMRYAALNQGADDLASFVRVCAGWPPDYKTLPARDKLDPFLTQADRYSDEQLYTLALTFTRCSAVEPQQVRRRGGARTRESSSAKAAPCATRRRFTPITS